MSLVDRLRSSADVSLAIVPMTLRDVTHVRAIEQVAYPVGWSEQVYRDELAQVDAGLRYYVVAKQGRTAVGYAGLLFVPDPDGDQAHVTTVAVDPAHRRTGIATELMLHLARRAIERGCTAWTLEVRANSAGAIELYRRFGFAPAGVRKRYYNNTDDALVMWCHDIDTAEYANRLTTLEQR